MHEIVWAACARWCAQREALGGAGLRRLAEMNPRPDELPAQCVQQKVWPASFF